MCARSHDFLSSGCLPRVVGTPSMATRQRYACILRDAPMRHLARASAGTEITLNVQLSRRSRLARASCCSDDRGELVWAHPCHQRRRTSARRGDREAKQRRVWVGLTANDDDGLGVGGVERLCKGRARGEGEQGHHEGTHTKWTGTTETASSVPPRTECLASARVGRTSRNSRTQPRAVSRRPGRTT